jgi:hypothetical protein
MSHVLGHGPYPDLVGVVACAADLCTAESLPPPKLAVPSLQPTAGRGCTLRSALSSCYNYVKQDRISLHFVLQAVNAPEPCQLQSVDGQESLPLESSAAFWIPPPGWTRKQGISVAHRQVWQGPCSLQSGPWAGGLLHTASQASPTELRSPPCLQCHVIRRCNSIPCRKAGVSNTTAIERQPPVQDIGPRQCEAGSINGIRPWVPQQV